NEFYVNQGDGSFVELGESLGVALDSTVDSRAAVWGDINNDGWADLYVGNRATPDRLFLNLEGEGFEEIAFAAGIIQLGHPKAVNMADLNNDGFLDIYVSNFLLENFLYLNNGDNTFTNFTISSNALDNGLAMGTVIFDYDKDGDMDIYLVHDGFEPNFLYQNNGNAQFIDVAPEVGAATESFGMGVDIGDVNNDGWLDIYIANLGSNYLLLNNGDGTYSNIYQEAAVGDIGMGWGTSLLDYDKDGLVDIYVANDYAFSPYRNVLYQNTGDLTFQVAEEPNPISNQYRSYGSACLDYNMDGNMDLLVTNKGPNQRSQLFRNANRPHAWIGFKLIGVESNKSAVGAKVRIVDDLGVLHYDEVIAGSSWSSQSSLLLHFGLGDATAIDTLTITWPSGLEQTLAIEHLDTYYTVEEGGEAREGVGTSITTSTTTIPADTPPLRVFPNPTAGPFTVEFFAPSNKPTQVEILDQLGRRLYNQQIDSPQLDKNTLVVELAGTLSTISAQLLLVKVQTGAIIATRKIWIQSR
ncbi:MAG: FG-GAP-like repeat-containing protein, partial [Bacteroidota bacterium]